MIVPFVGVILSPIPLKKDDLPVPLKKDDPPVPSTNCSESLLMLLFSKHTSDIESLTIGICGMICLPPT